MAGKSSVLFVTSLAVLCVQPVLSSDRLLSQLENIVEDARAEEMLLQGDSMLLTRGNLTDRTTRLALTDSRAVAIFKEVFNDIKAGFPNLDTLITKYYYHMEESKYVCGRSKTPKYCDFTAMMRQLKTLQAFKKLEKITHVRSLLEFKDYSLPKYMAQLKLSKEFRSSIASISFDTNVVITVSQEQAKAIGTYFKEVADFDKQIANQDRLFLQGRLDKLKTGSETMGKSIESSLKNIMKAAISIAAVSVAESTIRLAMDIASCFNPIKVVLGGCSPNDIMDRLEQLMAAIRTLTKAIKLAKGLKTLSDRMDVLKRNFEKNGQAILKMNTMVLSFSSLTEKDKLKKAKEFLDAYNNYSPQVTAQDLANIAASLEYVMEAGCEIIRETDTTTIGLGIEQVLTKDCNTISTKVAQLASYYTDWFSFQFELIDSFTKMVRGDVAKVYSNRLTTMNTQVKVHETVLGLTMDEVKLQTAATATCNVLEYRAGGTRPSVCKTGLFTMESVNQLIAYTHSLSMTKVKTFAWIPTAAPTTGNKAHIDVDKLLKGETVRFQLPLDDTAWMSQHKWLPATNVRGTAYFIERMDLYVPGLKCTDGTSPSVSVEVTNEKAVAIFTEPAPPKYLLAETEMKFQSEQTSPFCQPCAQVDFPVKANGDATTVKSTVKVCVRSNGIVHVQENTLFPPLYATWRIRLRQESCTLQKDTSLGFVPMISVSVTRTQIATNIDECWPNPCPVGRTCRDKVLTYEC